ncbi:MAG: penicillin acylase family protein [Sphingomicrobium sp.]
MHKHRPVAFLPLLLALTAASPPELARWKAQAQNVTITRDDWGIAHVRGKSDADAVFGMIYAQAEDDFPRIEANYLTALGRTAEAEGEKAVWQDLRSRLYVSEPELRADYAKSPAPMQRLMDAWAAGLNYFLATHPAVRPRVIRRFEPWMALSFTEGSIGGDIERIGLRELEQFYSGKPSALAPPLERERQGSNGIAVAPSLTQGGKALLLINPHTSWYFRSEQQVTSGQGLDVYGAATWGQFFIYQGFNAHAGWMHTSSGVDNVDEFSETIEGAGRKRCSRYGSSCRPIGVRPVTIRYRTPDGWLASRSFTTYFTHHGPIIRSENGRWIAFAMMNRPVEALEQSFLRTKARDFEAFLRVAQLKANSSNDTIFADDKGEIAYLHPQFVPRRNDRFDYTRPVDGSDPGTDWGSLHAISELPNVVSPPNGWVSNTNNGPWWAAGAFSPRPELFPRYMDTIGQTFRGVHALRLLTGSRGWTLDRLQAAAFDSYQPGFAALIPTLVQAYAALPAGDARRERLRGPVGVLRSWDYRWGAGSIAQSLAMAWALSLKTILSPSPTENSDLIAVRMARDTTADQKLQALAEAVAWLRRDFGRWQVPWGEINRFQRLSGEIRPPYSDAEPSIPIPFANGNYGSLASVRSLPKAGTKRWYGDYGNSFVAIVEFGPRVRARAVTAGGESGNPASPHFRDQAPRYASGALRDVYFYPDEIARHTERTYRPGE